MTTGIGVVRLSVEDMVTNSSEFLLKRFRGNAGSSCTCFREHLIDRMRELRHNSAI